MTYRELARALLKMLGDELDKDVTVELGGSYRCFKADLRFCDSNHPVLDPYYPVVYVPSARRQ